jgi:hypothetical protein
MQVGEVAASPAGDQDLLPDTLSMFKNKHAPSAPARLDGTHQAGRATTEDDCVKGLLHRKSQQIVITNWQLAKAKP